MTHFLQIAQEWTFRPGVGIHTESSNSLIYQDLSHISPLWKNTVTKTL